ncbi:hypothetical protein PROPHIGD91-2_82 [Mycobacterium phage prophiGD91-2]|nr:hypothetical protein PROPHIGD91-2_82 [Mycobacterium phage prophiGD91-2]
MKRRWDRDGTIEGCHRNGPAPSTAPAAEILKGSGGPL